MQVQIKQYSFNVQLTVCGGMVIILTVSSSRVSDNQLRQFFQQNNIYFLQDALHKK